MASDALEDEDTVLNRVARAIYGANVSHAREQAEQHDLQLDRLRRVFSAAQTETDRSVAILIFALAEDLMSEGLKANLNTGVKGGWAAVTEANGVLATASDRITILELLFWVRADTCEDLRRLKSIRNRFAHHADVSSFADQKIAGWISGLSAREKPVFRLYDEKERSNWRKFNARELYVMRACSTVGQLVSDLAVGPAARAHRVDPMDVEGRDFDALPDNLKEIRRVIAEVMLRFFPPA